MQKNTQIEYLRKQNNLSQSKLADELNISRQTISEWERGVSYPSVEKLLELSKIFNVSLDFLITGREFSSKNETKKSNNFKYSKLNNTDTYVFGKKDGYFVSTKDNENIGNTILTGCTGSGKSRFIIIPNLLQAIKRNESVFLTDPKGELYNQTASEFEKAGYNIKVINFANNYSLGWNPLLELPEDPFYFEKYLRLIYKKLFKINNCDEYWNNLSYNLFKAIALYVYFDESRPDSLKSLSEIYYILYKYNELDLANILKSLPENHPASHLSNLIFCNKELLHAKNNLVFEMEKIFGLRTTKEILSKNEFKLNDLFDKKTVCFLVTNEYDSEFSKLNSLLIDMLTFKILEGENILKHKLSIFLDEYFNISDSLQNIKYLIKNTRGMGVNTTIAIQSACQISLENMKVQSIFGLFDNIIMLGSYSVYDIELFAELFDISISEIRNLSNEYMIIKRSSDILTLKKEYPNFNLEIKDIKNYRIDFFE